MRRCSRWLLPALLPLALLCACGDDRSADPNLDSGYLLLDGGGPLGWDGQAPPPPPPPPKDSGGSSGSSKGKFCNGVFISGSGKITMGVQIGPVMLEASSGSCSACQGLPPGGHSMGIFSQGKKVGSGTAKIEPGKDYVFWVSMIPGSNKAKFNAGTLNPAKGQRCDNYTPKY